MTFPAGHQMLASEVNSLINPARVGVTARRAANQNIATGGAGTAISWDTVDADNSPSFITVTSTTFTIPANQGGVYGITVRAAGAWVNRVFLSISLTTALTGYPATFREDGNPVDAEVTNSIGPFPLLAGDSFTAVLFHTTGAGVNVTAWLACYKTGP